MKAVLGHIADNKDAVVVKLDGLVRAVLNAETPHATADAIRIWIMTAVAYDNPPQYIMPLNRIRDYAVKAMEIEECQTMDDVRSILKVLRFL